MKTKIIIIVLSLALIAADRGSFLGWGTEGRLKIVSGGVDGLYAASGVRNGGMIGQNIAPYPSYGNFTFTVWCKGAGVFRVQLGAESLEQSCNSTSWTQLVFPTINRSTLDLFVVTAQLKAGDYADMFCLYPSDFGSCTYFNHVTNPSFEQ